MNRWLVALVMVAGGCGSKQPTPATVGGTGGGAETRPETRPSEPHRPYEVGTWIAKLGDPRESERAITELEQLGDPEAIKPLGEHWLTNGRPPRVLAVIIGIARPLTADEAKATYKTGYEKTGRKASWDAALPYLVRAVVEIDPDNPRSVDSAQKAADGLGEAVLGGDAEKTAVDALIELAQKQVTKRSIAAQIAALRALGRHRSAGAATALAKMISRDAPPHPRTVDQATRRSAEETFGLYLAVTGASVNALGEHRTEAAVGPLILAMYRTPELFLQVRRALVASGPEGKTQLRNALAGKHEAVNALFKANKLDQYCGDGVASVDGMGTVGYKPPKQSPSCHPVSLMAFYAAIVLGDYYDASVAPDLVAKLTGPPVPPYYTEEVEAPNSQYNAVLDSLARIGAASAAAPVAKLWRGKKTMTIIRTLAVAAYPYLARDTSAVKDLGAIAADNTAEDQLRIEACLAFARIATTPAEIDILQVLAGKYYKAVREMATDAAKAKNAADRKTYEQRGDAYRGFGRMFQTHIARIDLGTRCKNDLGCYADALKLTEAEVVSRLEKHITDLKDWSADEKRDLYNATLDRALLEIGKAGTKATHLTDALLDLARSDNRTIRQAVLRALPKIATLPCTTCVTKLDAVIKAGEGKTALAELGVETTIVRNYFTWAK